MHVFRPGHQHQMVVSCLLDSSSLKKKTSSLFFSSDALCFHTQGDIKNFSWLLNVDSKLASFFHAVILSVQADGNAMLCLLLLLLLSVYLALIWALELVYLFLLCQKLENDSKLTKNVLTFFCFCHVSVAFRKVQFLKLVQ